MSNRTQVGLLVTTATLALATFNAAAQEKSLIPPFPNSMIQPAEDGDLIASDERKGNALTITVSPKDGRPRRGYAGVCVENIKPVNLETFNFAQAMIESSEKVTMDIKLEKPDFKTGTILLVNRGVVGKGKKGRQWDLRNAKEVGGRGTLSQTQRMCFFVLAHDFPQVKEVVVTISNITFGKQ